MLKILKSNHKKDNNNNWIRKKEIGNKEKN